VAVVDGNVRKLQDKCGVGMRNRNHLDCQGWAESPSRRLGSWPSRQTSQILHQFLTVCQMPSQSTHHTMSSQSQDDNTICRRAARNRPVAFDERALVRSQARKQGRRLHDEENDIDGKFAQFDVSSGTEKLFLSNYHNQLAPSCTSVRSRREYQR